jgi:hypothetical protein
VFDSLEVFWHDQHRDMRQKIDDQKLKIRASTNTQLFVDVRPFVHDYALQVIIAERRKLPADLSTLPDEMECSCSVRSSMGLPCQHEIRLIMENPGTLRLTDIDAHWHYEREATEPQLNRRILLNPSVVKSKGRPKGALGKRKNGGQSGTRRDPSLFEHEAIDLLSPTTIPSTAPSVLQNPALKRRGRPSKNPPSLRASSAQPPLSAQTPPFAQPSRSQSTMTPPLPPRRSLRITQKGGGPRWDRSGRIELERFSSTQHGIERGAGTIDDLYDPGTARQRAYLRSVAPSNLARVVKVVRHEEEAEKDIGNTMDMQVASAVSTGAAEQGNFEDSRNELDIFPWEI